MNNFHEWLKTKDKKFYETIATGTKKPPRQKPRRLTPEERAELNRKGQTKRLIDDPNWKYNTTLPTKKAIEDLDA